MDSVLAGDLVLDRELRKISFSPGYNMFDTISPNWHTCIIMDMKRILMLEH